MAGPRPVPRPGITKARSCCSVSLSKTLITLPLVLAAIALLLQFSGKQPSPEASALTLTGHMERSMLLESQQHPKLETSGRRRTQLERPARGGGRLGARRAPGLGQAWRAPEPSARLPRVAFMVTTSDSLAQISVWLAYHRAMGVGTFYLFVDGQAARPEVQEALRRERGVRVVPRDAELKRRHEGSRIWNETWLSAFFHKPCNHELFVIQSLNMEVGIQMAQADGQDWVLHVDTDELIYPSGSPDLSVQEVLAQVPEDVDTLVFPNYESLPEADDVADPFTQVTLFKKNYGHVVPDVYFKNYGTIARGNPNYFITYGNGKSAARVQEGLRPNGAHRWHSYTKMPKEWSSDQAAVLHYTYNRFQDLKSRRDRCDCAPTEEDAKRCFILPFDRMAFLEASLKTDEELLKWFRERLVWSDPEVVNDLLKKGLFARIYEPQIMIRGFLQAAKAGAAGCGVAVAQSSAGAAASGASPSSDSTGAAAVGAADSAGTAVGTAASSGAGAAQKAAAVAGMRDEVDAARQAAAAEQHAATGSTALGSATTTADAAALKEAAVSAAQAQAAAAATAQTQQAATTEQAAAAAQQAAAAAGAAAQQAAGTGTQAAGANAQSAAVANQQAAGAQQVAAGGATGQAGGGAQATVAGDAQAAGAGQVAQQQQQQQAAAAGGGTAGADGQTAGQAVGAVQQAVGAGQAVAGGQATQAATQQQAAAADAAAAAAAAQRAQEVATAATAGLQHAAVVQTQAGAQAQAATA